MVFDKLWFVQNQKALVHFANTVIGRAILRIDYSGPIDAILPNAIFIFQKDGTIRGEFRTHDKYSKRLYYGLKPFWRTLHNLDSLFGYSRISINFGFDTLPFYPDASSGGTTVDGYCARVSVNETFSTIRAGSGNQAIKTSTFDSIVRLAASATTNQFSGLNRPIYTFDTAAVTGTVTAATFSIDIGSKQNGNGSDDMYIVGATPASNNDLVNADFTTLGSTSFGMITYAAVSTSGYNPITMTPSGIAAVTVGGITKLGARGGWDFNNSFTGSWSSGAESRLLGYYADQTGISRDPKLDAVWTPPGATTNSNFFAFISG